MRLSWVHEYVAHDWVQDVQVEVQEARITDGLHVAWQVRQSHNATNVPTEPLGLFLHYEFATSDHLAKVLMVGGDTNIFMDLLN